MSAGGRGASGGLAAADEMRHRPDGASAEWQETWWFDAWRPDGALALTCRLTLLPALRRAAYWCQLVRAGAPLVHLAELDAPLPATGLAVRAAGLWADHVCEAPFEQWTVANEGHAVALDDPDDATGRAYGEAMPMAVDLEWYAAGSPVPTAGGYAQDGEVHGLIELGSGAIRLEGSARRGHEWGTDPAHQSAPEHPPAGLRAPLRLTDGTVLDQVATSAGWVRWRGPD